MSEPEVLGEFRDYHQMIEILRARKGALQLTDRWFDDYSGLARGHIGKLFGDARVKHFGPESFPVVAACLAIKFVVVVDPDQAAVMAGRWEGRLRPEMPMPARASMRAIERFKPIIIGENNKRLAPLGAAARNRKLTPKQRKKLAKRAARIRWQIERASALKPGS